MPRLTAINLDSIRERQPTLIRCWRCPGTYKLGEYDKHLRETPGHPLTWNEKLQGPYPRTVTDLRERTGQ